MSRVEYEPVTAWEPAEREMEEQHAFELAGLKAVRVEPVRRPSLWRIVPDSKVGVVVSTQRRSIARSSDCHCSTKTRTRRCSASQTYVFLQRGAAHEDGPSSDVLSLAQKGVGQFVMFVEDVDAVRDELHQGDVAIISGPADRDWDMRTLTFADPGGYTWEITQELPSAPSPS
jgi:hypothetical protein